MDISERELGNLIERAFVKWFNLHNVDEDFMPSDIDCRDLSKEVLSEVKKLDKWLI